MLATGVTCSLPVCTSVIPGASDTWSLCHASLESMSRGHDRKFPSYSRIFGLRLPEAQLAATLNRIVEDKAALLMHVAMRGPALGVTEEQDQKLPSSVAVRGLASGIQQHTHFSHSCWLIQH